MFDHSSLPARNIWGYYLAQGYLAYRLEQTGIKPTTFQLLGDLFNLLTSQLDLHYI